MSGSEYKKLVLADYDLKVKTGLMPSELLLPTPANIKSVVVKVCENGLTTHDEKILRSFVGQKSDAAAYRNAFSVGKADPFRPLVNFLNDRSIDTNQRNIDLLALLIGFVPRPYHPDLKPPGNTGTAAIEKVIRAKKPAPERQSPKTASRRLFIIITVLFFIVSASAFLFFHYRRPQPAGREGCMIWGSNQYQPIDCYGTKYPAVNAALMDHFRRITRPDTLTLKAVGKVWYAKYKGNVEFFTDSGYHPLDSNRRLLPMSVHILKKYVYHIEN